LHLIFVFSSITLFATKPFSTWQLDKTTKIKFEVDECRYDIEIDNFQIGKNYRHTEMFTDEIGRTILSFDVYNNRIAIRDSSDIVLFEHLFDNQELNTNIESIILPFYSQKLCYFVYISTS